MTRPQTRKDLVRRGVRCAIFLAGCFLTFSSGARTAEATDTNLLPHGVLLLDSFGRPRHLTTNQIPAALLPPGGVVGGAQLPSPTRGSSVPESYLERQQEARNQLPDLVFFPKVPPVLAPYLTSEDEYGNTAARPGPLIPIFPMEPYVQGAKTWLSQHGLRYSFDQTLNFVNMTDVMKGDNALGFYTADFKGKLTIFDNSADGTAGWLSAHIEAKSGLGAAGQTQSASRNLGSITDPTGIWSGINGIRVPELAWQQSLRGGEVVVVAGMIKQDDYLDSNVYAQSGRGQFMNSALINSMVLPLPSYHFGLNLQWQPHKEFYAMLGASTGGNPGGFPPWYHFSWEDWSLEWEFGYAPHNFLGWGEGVYRVQPFVADASGSVGGGLGFNFQQRLGQHVPLGCYGRFGFGGEHVTAGAAAQAGTGLSLHAPLELLGLVPRLNNDLLGLGVVWSQPSASAKTVYHENEFALETFYTLQLSPTTRLQPDIQVVWNPAYNPSPGPALVAQLQLILSW